MDPSLTGHRSRRAVRRVLATLVVVAAIALAPTAVVAHVNRTVGPYTFLVVLVEEPYFATNHAGFQFWVHDGDAPVADLDRTLHAQAIGHGRTVDLAVSPWDADQLYTVDRGLDGQPFDPLGGGRWSLRLTGSIDGMPLDESFAVDFPAYPRVGTVKADPAAAGAGSEGDFVPPYLVVLLLGIGAVVGVRGIRRGVGVPSLTMGSELDGQALEPSIGRRP